MKKFLLALSSVFLFAASPLSAQITLHADSVLLNDGSVFGRDEVKTIKFDSLYSLLNQRFDSAGHNFVSDSFNGYGGMFTFDTSGSIHSSHLFTTGDASGFVLLDAEAMADTVRATLTSPAFSTTGFNTLKVVLDHHYKYSVYDSTASLMISTDNANWNVIKDYKADAMDKGTSVAFANDTFALGAQYLNKPSVRLRLVYASDTGYQWAVNNMKVISDKFDYGYAFFKPETNAEWDLSNIEYDGGTRVYVRKPAPAPFRFIDSIYNEEFKNIQYTTYNQNYFTTTGIIAHADLTYGQEIPIDYLTGNLGDTLSIPTQFVIQYSGLYIKQAFPMTYNSKWGSDFSHSSVFFLKGFGLAYPQFVAGLKKTHVTSRDTVVGWGKIRVKDGAGIVQPYMDVLQLKTVYTQVDSFLTTNNPLNEQAKINIFKTFMGTLSGIDTPAITTQYTKISYMRVGEIHPLVTVFMNDTFVYKIEIHANNPWPATVPQATAEQHNKVNVYPNPVSGRMVNVEIPGADNGKWNCQIFNTIGQHVANQTLDISNTNNRAVVQIPSVVATGFYYLHITKDGQTVAVKQIEVQN